MARTRPLVPDFVINIGRDIEELRDKTAGHTGPRHLGVEPGLLPALPLTACDLGRQGLELRLPEAAKACEPLVDLGHRSRIDLVDPARPFGRNRGETMVPQHLQMLGDGGLCDPELPPHDRDDLSRSVAILRQDLPCPRGATRLGDPVRDCAPLMSTARRNTLAV